MVRVCGINLRLLLLPPSLLLLVSAYDPPSRWGQATAVIADALFVYGGKVDEFNQFSYPSAPNVNDILLLSLSSSFSAASPPWVLVSSSTNQSTSQGPALAWGTLSAFNNTQILLFGGQYGVDSPSSSADAGLLDVFSRLDPQWRNTSLANEPPSRMRHSSATTPTGLVFIFGGEKTDGSGICLSDHFYFDPDTLDFALLPTNNAPPDIFGHASIILSDRRVLVFGGYSPSKGNLLPFSTIWVLDAMLNWTVITTATTAVPSPRVAFAAVLIEGGKIVVHGGSDAAFQTNFADGWVLDTTLNPMTWTAVDGLSQLGGRRDHFAVHSGGQVIFGFGYANNGPAPALLQIFDPSSGSFVPTFTPAPATATPTQTLPPVTHTSHANTPTSSQPYSSTHGIQPTSTLNPGDGTSPSDDDNTESSSSTTAIALGSSFGALSLIVIGLGAAYYIRKRGQKEEGEGEFMALDGDDDEGEMPAGMMEQAEEPHGGLRVLSSLGMSRGFWVASRMRSMRRGMSERRDMLADEDARSFGEWYDSRRRDGMAGSSWSLRSILGGGRLRSRNGSTTSHGTGGGGPTLWREKSDAFGDGASLMRDEETGFTGAAVGGGYGPSRPRARRDASYASSLSGPTSYRDPFVDPIHKEPKQPFEPVDLYNEHPKDVEDVEPDSSQPSVRYVSPLAPLRTVLPPLSQQQGHLLSPLSEHTSQSTLPHISSSGSSHAQSSDNIFSPITSSSRSRATSMTSMNQASTSGSPLLPSTSTSIIGTGDPMVLTGNKPNKPMRRSDSWWTKFARTSLLDRRSSDAARTTRYDIRDPTPAPRLVAIEEASVRSPSAQNNHSPGCSEQDKSSPSQAPPQSHPPLSRAGSKVYAAGGAGYGKSMSSLRTADSEAIERMAGMVDVTQREKSTSRWGSGSTSSGGGLSVDTHGSVSEVGDNASLREDGVEPEAEGLLAASPVDEAETPRALQDAGPSGLPSPQPAAALETTMKFAPVASLENNGKSGKVSERIQEYERRMSLEAPISPLPTNSKHREERTKKRVEVDYGLVPRPSLFVANPDHQLSTSSNS